MKLKARIPLSPEFPALGGVFITAYRFRRSARQAENGFVAMENCFVGTRTTKQFQTKINVFNQLKNFVD
jgi:hypothetical protein